MFSIQQIPLLALGLLPLVASQTTKVCDVNTTVCFHQIFDSKTNSTFGFVLPPKTSGTANTQDFLASITTTLPYGYVGFGFAAAGEMTPFSSTAFMTRFVKPGAVGTLETALIAQQSLLSEDGSSLQPFTGESGDTTISLSPLSYYTDTSVTFIYRSQKSSVISSKKGGDLLTLFVSHTPPTYATPTALNATLSVRDAVISQVDFDDVDDLRDAEYNSYVKALSLE